MSIIRFTDGMTIDTSGPYRLLRERDGLYVVGNGFLCAVDDEDAGLNLIEQLVVGFADSFGGYGNRRGYRRT